MRKPRPAPAEPDEPEEPAPHVEPTAADDDRLDESGHLARATVEGAQRALGATVDGVWSFMTTRILQHRLGVKVDGLMGPATIRALQARVGAVVDGTWPSITRVYNSGQVETDPAAESETTAQLQRSINEGTL